MSKHLINTISAFMIFMFVLNSAKLFSQKIERSRCGQPDFTNRLDSEALQQLQNINNTVSKSSVLRNFNVAATKGEVAVIPVVFHVIHEGEAIGSGRNISDEYIHAQIEQLNLDFRRKSPDAAFIPEIFRDLHSDVEIEFCLANTDPSGNATGGITRHFYRDSKWTVNEGDAFDYLVKKETSWNPDNYLNIWTANILKIGYYGWAYFPNVFPKYYDGVVSHYGTIGSLEKPFPFDFRTSGGDETGKITTHELGHYFDLFHTWGINDESQANCIDDDGIDDTPLSSNAYNVRCPLFGRSSTTCGSQDMYVNYMGYSSCAYMFTHGQKDKMLNALYGSRSSLLNSYGCEPPDKYELKLYPNPTNDYFNIDISLISGSIVNENSEIIIYNTLGRKVFESKVNLKASNSINISSLSPNQIYFINIADVNGDVHEFKILKKG